jgi:hypothetical protein
MADKMLEPIEVDTEVVWENNVCTVIRCDEDEGDGSCTYTLISDIGETFNDIPHNEIMVPSRDVQVNYEAPPRFIEGDRVFCIASGKIDFVKEVHFVNGEGVREYTLANYWKPVAEEYLQPSKVPTDEEFTELCNAYLLEKARQFQQDNDDVKGSISFQVFMSVQKVSSTISVSYTINDGSYPHKVSLSGNSFGELLPIWYQRVRENAMLEVKALPAPKR